MNTFPGKIIYSEDTPYGEMQILDTHLHGQPVRYFLVDGWQESAMYLDPDLSDRLIFPYMQKLSWPLSLRPDGKNILLIGGGGFVWPRHVLRNDLSRIVFVTELSPEVVRISEDFFGLRELQHQYGNRLSVYTGDGFGLLRKTSPFTSASPSSAAENAVSAENAASAISAHTAASSDDDLMAVNSLVKIPHLPLQFDFIVNDAFVGARRSGRTLEDTSLIHDRLTPEGIYAVNVTSAVKGLNSIHLSRFMSILSRVFRFTDAMICEPSRSPYESQNILAIASDAPLIRIPFSFA